MVRQEDSVQVIANRWAELRPDLDASPMLVLGRIRRIADAADARLRPPFAAAGLAPGDFDVLAALRRRGDPYTATPTDLAASTLVTQGATTKRVERLCQQGLVIQTRSTVDKRGRVVRLTSEGLALVDTLMETHLSNQADILEQLSGPERRQLAVLLAGLLQSLELDA